MYPYPYQTSSTAQLLKEKSILFNNEYFYAMQDDIALVKEW